MKVRLRKENLIVCSLLLALCLICFICPAGNTKSFGVQEYALSISYLVVLILTIRNNKFLSLPSLFLFALGFFGIFGVILSIFGLYDYRVYTTSFIDYVWSDTAKKVVLNSYLILLTISHAVFNLVDRHNKKPARKNKAISDAVSRFGKILFFATLPFAVISAVIQVINVSSGGYASLYIGGGYSAATQLLSPFVTFNTVGFYSFCAGIPQEKDFNKVAGMFLTLSMISSLTGARGSLVIPLLFFLYYRFRVYGKGLTVLQVICLAIFLSIMLVIFAFVRGQTNDSVFQMIIGQVTSVSGSISIAAIFVDSLFELKTFGLPYLFGPVTRLFDVITNWSIYSNGQSLEMVAIRNDLAHQISYYCNPAAYLSGNGMGGNMVAEMLQFGLIGLIILSIIFCVVVRFIEINWPTSIIAGFLLYLLFSGLFFAPRASYVLIDTYSLFKWIILFCVIYTLSVWAVNRSGKNLKRDSRLHGNSSIKFLVSEQKNIK